MSLVESRQHPRASYGVVAIGALNYLADTAGIVRAHEELMTRNDCRRNVITPVNIWSALVAACDGNPFSRGRNNSVPTIPGHWFLYAKYLVARCNFHEMENTISGRLSARNWSIIRSSWSACRGHLPAHISTGSRTRSLPHIRYSRASVAEVE